MPRLNQPPSMKRRAMQVVAEHFETICYGGMPVSQLRRMMDDDTYTSVESPMAHWPADLLEEMMEAASEQRPLGRTLLHHLVQPHLESFNLPCGVGDVYFAIAFITDRCCQNLRKLDLSYISYLGPNLLVRLVSHLPRIRSINFRMTPVTDQVLGQMGRSCPELRHLDITSTPVTDRGIERLSRPDDEGDGDCEPGAQQLVRLSILDTNVTQYGLAVLLHSCPQLRHVEHESLYQAFVHFKPGRQFRLVQLKATNEVHEADSVTSAIECCPGLESVSLTASASFGESALWSFTHLSHLTELTLANGADAFVLDFYTSVVPLLQTLGDQLNNLILTRFTCVDVSVIGTSCLNLKNLALSEICHFVPATSDGVSHALFGQLHAVELWALPGVQTPPSVVKQLTCNCPDVRNLLFRNCDCVDDALLTDMWTANPMSNLSHVTLDGCHNVTLGVLLALIRQQNDLNVLRLWNLAQVNHADYTRLTSAIRSGNMDVLVDWYPYELTT